MLVSEVNFPHESLLHGKEGDTYYRDAFLVNTSRRKLPAKSVFHSVFAYPPNFILRFFKFKNTLSLFFKLSTVEFPQYFTYNTIYQGRKIGDFTFDKITDGELVVVAEGKNMEIWMSVLRITDTRFVMSTLVNFKTEKGRFYMHCLRPFHQFLTKYAIKQALKSKRL